MQDVQNEIEALKKMISPTPKSQGSKDECKVIIEVHSMIKIRHLYIYI